MSNYGKTAYNERNYEQIHIWVRLGHKGIIQRAAAAQGESINRYVAEAINEALQRDGYEVADMRLDRYEKSQI